jgi:TusA-related sulfurtransferase
MTISKMKETGRGEIEVLVDNEVSRENVTRAASHQGWEVTETQEGAGDYRLVLKKG